MVMKKNEVGLSKYNEKIDSEGINEILDNISDLYDNYSDIPKFIVVTTMLILLNILINVFNERYQYFKSY